MLKPSSQSLTQKLAKMRVVANLCSIQNRDFSIIASNCTGTLPYRFLKIPYSTPTVNLLFYAPCYLKFVKNLEHYLAQPMTFTALSKYPRGEQTRVEHEHYFPVGQLDDIEVHFMHYYNETEAVEKWERRKQRINFDNLIFAFTDKDLCTPELLAEFDAIDHPQKYVLTAKHIPEISSAVQVPYFADQDEIGDCYTHYNHLAHIDFRKLIDQPVTCEQPQPALYASQ